jgi:hypothetical protein
MLDWGGTPRYTLALDTLNIQSPEICQKRTLDVLGAMRKSGSGIPAMVQSRVKI